MTDFDSDIAVDRRQLLATTGAAGAAAMVAGCSGGSDTASTTDATSTTDSTTTTEAPDEFPVTITQGKMPTTLDPHDHRDIPTDIVMRQSYEGLLSRSADGEIIPMLATDWERTEEGLVRFTIREGPTFHETGNEVTPEDVAYSINRMVKKDVGFTSPQAGQLSGVTGAEVVDGERAVEVHSDGLNPIVFSEFAIYCDVVEKQWVKDHEKSHVAKNMNGTGPFVQTDYEENVRVVFERNEDYWREPPAVTKLTLNSASKPGVRVNQLIAGETDLVVNVPPQAVSRVENSDASVDAVGSTRVIYNGMKATVEPFSSPKFRRAMNYAVDSQQIVDDVLQGFGAKTSQPTLEPFFGYDDELDPYPHDPEKAAQLVDESGHAGASITLHTPAGRYLKDIQIARAVANMIDELPNVSCEIKQRNFGTLAGKLVDSDITTGPDFYLIGWGNATFDASQTINPTLTSDGSLTSYKNEELDGLVSDANATADQSEREDLLRQANTLANEQAPWIFLNRQYSVYGTSGRVQWKPRNDERIDAYAIRPAE